MPPALEAAPPCVDGGVQHALLVEHRPDLGQRCLRITIDLPVGATVASFAESQRTAQASYLTVQLDEGVHLTLTPPELEFVNHSCEPNVSFDMVRLALVAIAPLSAGDELTYAYPSTEWTMTRPFVCACGAATCMGVVDGASRLPDAVLSRYPLTPFVEAMMVKRAAACA